MTSVNAHCQVDLSGRPSGQALTVGDKFFLICDYQNPVQIELSSSARILFSDEEKLFSLHNLKVQESTKSNFKLVVTGYVPGEYKNQNLIISDGQLSIAANDLSWTITSILTPKEEPKPVPSEGPFLISYPLWFWITLASVTILVSAIIASIFYRKRKRKLMKAELEKHMTMLTPFSEFSRDMRLARRRINDLKADVEAAAVIKKIDEDFRLYLIRELKVPALNNSYHKVLQEIRREHKSLFEANKAPLRRVLSELAQATQDLDRVKIRDCEDLAMLTRNVAESIYQSKRRLKS